jgi:hypothetical protein
MEVIAHEEYVNQALNTTFPVPKFKKGFAKEVNGFEVFRNGSLENTGRSVYVSNIRIAQDIGVRKIESSGKKKILVVEENAFVFDWFSYPLKDYYHFLFDFLGAYELIKKHFPDTKLYILYSEKILDEMHTAIEENSLIREAIDIYKLSNKYLINLDSYDSVSFKKVYFYTTNMIGSFVDNFYENEVHYTTLAALKKYNLAIAFVLKKLFPQSKKQYRKIFLSRLNSNNRFRIKKQAFIKKYILNLSNESFSDEEQKFLRDHKVDLNIDADILMLNENILRPPSLEDELKIEKFFENNGYEIITFDNCSIAEQAYAMSEASLVVGLSGTAIGNAVFCNNKTKILVLNTTDAYKFPHMLQTRWFGKYAVEQPRLNFDLNRSFSGQEIIEAAKKQKEFFDV